MGAVTSISWTDASFNGWIGCTKISPGCDHCYAEIATPTRAMKVVWGVGAARHRTGSDTWSAPRKWQRQAAAFREEHGRRRRVFCASLADVFDNDVPLEWRADLFALIRETPDLEYQLLTKRISNVRPLTAVAGGGWPANAALGLTMVNQEEVDRDWPKAQDAAATVHPLYLFASIEPMLGPIDLTSALTGTMRFKASTWHGRKLDWVIVGGESGLRARTTEISWVRSIVNQCAEHNVPCFVKQLGARPLQDARPIRFIDRKAAEMIEWPLDLRVRQFPAVAS